MISNRWQVSILDYFAASFNDYLLTNSHRRCVKTYLKNAFYWFVQWNHNPIVSYSGTTIPIVSYSGTTIPIGSYSGNTIPIGSYSGTTILLVRTVEPQFLADDWPELRIRIDPPKFTGSASNLKFHFLFKVKLSIDILAWS